MSDGTAMFGEVVGSGAWRAPEGENCDASVRTSWSCRAHCVAVRGSQRGARSADGTATALAVVLSIARPRKKEKSRSDEKSEGTGTPTAPSHGHQETNLFWTENCRRMGYTSAGSGAYPYFTLT